MSCVGIKLVTITCKNSPQVHTGYIHPLLKRGCLLTVFTKFSLKLMAVIWVELLSEPISPPKVQNSLHSPFISSKHDVHSKSRLECRWVARFPLDRSLLLSSTYTYLNDNCNTLNMQLCQPLTSIKTKDTPL